LTYYRWRRKFRVLGFTAIVSHLARNAFLMKHPEAADPWLEHGALLQVTARSLLGHFGLDIEKAAWYWLERGAVALVATDAHDLDSRRPRMAAAYHGIRGWFCWAAAERLCISNPVAVLTGVDVAPRDVGVWEEVQR
jgi:protein-tyrosine phosphatase